MTDDQSARQAPVPPHPTFAWSTDTTRGDSSEDSGSVTEPTTRQHDRVNTWLFPFKALPYPGKAARLAGNRESQGHPCPHDQDGFEEDMIRSFTRESSTLRGRIPAGLFFKDDVQDGFVAWDFPENPLLACCQVIPGAKAVLDAMNTTKSDEVKSFTHQASTASLTDRGHVSYAALVTKQSYVHELADALVDVLLKSMDFMCVSQVCINFWFSRKYANLWEEDAAAIVPLFYCLYVLSILLWVASAYTRMEQAIWADIEFVGDLVWSNNYKGENPRPAHDHVASNLRVRFAHFFMFFFDVPYIIREIVPLCHPRKGAMKFGAFGGCGKIPRQIALGYLSKAMFRYECTKGRRYAIFLLLFGKVPLAVVRIMIYAQGIDQSILLVTSIVLSLITGARQTAQVLQALLLLFRQKRALTKIHDSLASCDSAKLTPKQVAIKNVVKKELCQIFFLVDQEGELRLPDARTLLRRLCGCGGRRQNSGEGFLAKWRFDAAQPGFCRVLSEGGNRIPRKAIDQLDLADETRKTFRTHFWYSDRGEVSYSEPGAEGFKLARLVTKPYFLTLLTKAFSLASLSAMFTLGAFNLCVEFAAQKATMSETQIVFVAFFATSRLLWLVIAATQAHRCVVMDWEREGDFVTNAGIVDRIHLAMSLTTLSCFCIPRIILEAPSMLHPERGVMPFCSFGGKTGPRAFALGFATQDMYDVNNLHSIISSLPLLVADVVTSGIACYLLVDTISSHSIDIVNMREADHPARVSLLLMLVLLAGTGVLLCKIRVFEAWQLCLARKRYKHWIHAQLAKDDLPVAERRALMQQEKKYFKVWF